jgi:uncharacterized membrane protein
MLPVQQLHFTYDLSGKQPQVSMSVTQIQQTCTDFVYQVIHSFGAGVCEALPVQLVNDIFFIHERGKRLGYYTVALCLGATGPIYAGYMLAGGYSWRLFFYVEFAFAMALFFLAFFFVEETTYDREAMKRTLGAATIDDMEKPGKAAVEEVPVGAPGRKTFVSTLKPWSRVYPGPFFTVMLRSFTYFLVPSVFWVISTYGKSGQPAPNTPPYTKLSARDQHRAWGTGLQLHIPPNHRRTAV